MTRTASGLIENEDYWRWYEERAKALGSDGCTAVPEWNRRCCLRHDVHCREKVTQGGQAITRAEADALFWECNRLRSPFSVKSPRSWIRFIGVRIGAWWDARKDTK